MKDKSLFRKKINCMGKYKTVRERIRKINM